MEFEEVDAVGFSDFDDEVELFEVGEAVLYALAGGEYGLSGGAMFVDEDGELVEVGYAGEEVGEVVEGEWFGVDEELVEDLEVLGFVEDVGVSYFLHSVL